MVLLAVFPVYMEAYIKFKFGPVYGMNIESVSARTQI